MPVVLDADGLNAFAGRAEDLADRKADLILTPHAGEFARVAGVSTGEVAADRVRHVRELAARTSATVLLKGSRTLVAAPDGRSGSTRPAVRSSRPAARATCSPG